MRSSSWLAPAPPALAIEIASHRITVVEMGRTGTQPSVLNQATVALAPGMVVPALAGVNIAHIDEVAAALSAALQQAGIRGARRAALVVPDSIARVSLLTLEQVPERASDVDQLVRWQLKKATPFPIDEAQVSHFIAHRDAAGVSMATVVARRDVIAQYEAVAAAAHIHAGTVDLASLNVMNAVIGAGAAVDGDWLLVHLASEATTLAILRGDQLMFYRHRTAVDEESLGSLVHQTAMYHEDRLGGAEFAHVWLCGAGTTAEVARQEISDRLRVPAEAVDVRTAVGMRDPELASPALLDAIAAPIGVLIRDRKAA